MHASLRSFRARYHEAEQLAPVAQVATVPRHLPE